MFSVSTHFYFHLIPKSSDTTHNLFATIPYFDPIILDSLGSQIDIHL